MGISHSEDRISSTIIKEYSVKMGIKPNFYAVFLYFPTLNLDYTLFSSLVKINMFLF